MSTKLKLYRITGAAVLGIFLIFYLLPPFWMICISLSGGVNILRIFSNFSIVHYLSILTRGYARYLLNSFIISSFSTLLALVLGVPAAYSLARSHFKGKGHLHFWILTSQMIPAVIVLIPFFIIYRKFGLIDTHIGMILIYALLNLALVIWLMRGFFEEIPRDLDEAALIDGCSPLQSFLKILLPVAKIGLGTTAIICFIFSWNEFLIAVILTGPTAKTLPVTMYNYLSGYRIYWGGLCAAGVLTITPVVLFGIIIRKYLIRGMTFGAIKE